LQCLGLGEDPVRLSQLYLEQLSTAAYLLPHAQEALAFMSRRASLTLMSNGIASVQRGRIARSGIEIFFRDIIISEEVGLAKPDIAIFQLALSRLGLPAAEVLCVGDSPSSDIRGGFFAGLDTCWLADNAQPYPRDEPAPTLTIVDLRDLYPLLPPAGLG